MVVGLILCALLDVVLLVAFVLLVPGWVLLLAARSVMGKDMAAVAQMPLWASAVVVAGALASVALASEIGSALPIDIWMALAVSAAIFPETVGGPKGKRAEQVNSPKRRG